MRCFTAFTALTLLASATAVRYTIDPSLPSGEGGDFEVDCLLLVQPGDECYLLNGDHKHDGLTRTHGTRDQRIYIRGESDKACIKGSNTQDRALQIAHDYYTIENLCFNGKHGSEYVATAVYVLGADKVDDQGDTHGVMSSVTGLQMYNLEIKNWDEECVHLRYFVTFTEIRGCTIQHCGKHSFDNDRGGAVGEAVYVGTALDQVKDGKTPEPKIRTGSEHDVDADVCRYNWIHQNTMRTYGNECVDVKEGSTDNLIENNVCEQQRDENSGCMGSRGSGNTFRYNQISECSGAGVRCGGDKDYGYGNNIYDNVISNADYGAFNIMTEGQGKVCGNKLSGIDVVTQGEYKEEFDTDIVTGPCPDDSTPGDITTFFDTTPTWQEKEEVEEKDMEYLQADEDGSNGGSPGSSGSDTYQDVQTSSAATATSATDSGDGATPLEEEEEEIGPCAGVNCADAQEQELIPEEDKIFDITTNYNAFEKGIGGCSMVLPVVKLKASHKSDMDPETAAINLFDADLETYFSVNRESTYHVLELETETLVHGVSIGFFMKDAAEQRIQTFDVAVRTYEDHEYTTVISRQESSGVRGDIQHFEFISPVSARFVKIESHGNTENNWTAFTEVEVCGMAPETNALFGGVRKIKQEVAELAGTVCTKCKLLAPKFSRVTGEDNVKEIYDGCSTTRWSTQATQAKNDLDNAKITATFKGEVRLCNVNIAFFDGQYARPHLSIYKQSANAKTWTPVWQHQVAKRTDSFQRFDIQAEKVNSLYIVGNGNDVGNFTKVSELEFWGC